MPLILIVLVRVAFVGALEGASPDRSNLEHFAGWRGPGVAPASPPPPATELSKKRQRNGKPLEFAAPRCELASELHPAVDRRCDQARSYNLLGINTDRHMSKKRPEFSYEVRRDGDVVIIPLRGHLDGFAAMGLRPEIEELLDDGAMCAVFDCRELSYTGMYGYVIVLNTAKEPQGRKGRFALCDLAPDPKDIFRLTSMTTLNIAIFDSLDEALAAFRK